MSRDNEAWINRQVENSECRRDYERERLAAWVLDSIADLMDQKGVSRADLARALGTSRANVTQIFSGSRNCTLSTISEMAWACGQRAVVRFEPLRNGEFVSSPVVLVESVKPKVVTLTTPQPFDSRPATEAESLYANGGK